MVRLARASYDDRPDPACRTRDQAMHKAHYEALRAALEAEGHHATVELPMEKRSVEHVMIELAIHVGEDAAAEASSGSRRAQPRRRRLSGRCAGGAPVAVRPADPRP
jgi:hypothetical protein